MSYDYLTRQAYCSLDHSEGKSLSVQSPPYRLETQLPKDILGRVWRLIPRTNKGRSRVGFDNFDDNAFKLTNTQIVTDLVICYSVNTYKHKKQKNFEVKMR